MQTSLLSAEATSLGNESSFEDGASSSEFSRLISVVHNHEIDSESSAFQSRRRHEVASVGRFERRRDRPCDDPYHGVLPNHMSTVFSPSFTIVVTGACSVLFVGFVWASFMSNTWSETVLVIELSQLPIAIQTNLVPIASTSLSSLIQRFLQADQIGISTLVWLTSLLVPCLFMVLAPSWIVQVYSTRKGHHDRSGTQSTANEGHAWIRDGFHLLFRWAATVAFVVLLMSTSIQCVTLKWTNTILSVQNKMGAGLATFTVGVAFALFTISMLRLLPLPRSLLSGRRHLPLETTLDAFARDSTASNIPIVADSGSSNARQQRQDGRVEGRGDETRVLMRILEEEPLVEEDPAVQDDNVDPMDRDNDTTLQAIPTGVRNQTTSETKTASFSQVLVVFQVGLLSVLLWVPAVVLPILRFEISGFVSEFIPGNSTKTISLVEVPSALYRDSLAARTQPWIIWLVGTILIVLTVACPLLATAFGISTWVLPPDANPATRKIWSRHSIRLWLSAIHPAVGTIVLAVAVFVAANGVEAWSESLFSTSDSESHICSPFERLVGERCLVIRGSTMIGAWFYLVHAFLLEAFIVLTLQWS